MAKGWRGPPQPAGRSRLHLSIYFRICQLSGTYEYCYLVRYPTALGSSLSVSDIVFLSSMPRYVVDLAVRYFFHLCIHPTAYVPHFRGLSSTLGRSPKHIAYVSSRLLLATGVGAVGDKGDGRHSLG